jgi:DMSO/TMAO reductase YedYZ molybdopterin-dependent catalytic subunit
MTQNDTTPHEESDAQRQSQRDRYLSRRRYLLSTGAVAGAGILAGCGQGSNSDGNETDGGGNTTERGTATEESTATADGPETPRQQQGQKRIVYTKQKLLNKYPGLEILSPSPPNAETAVTSSYSSFTTSVDVSYIRSHYDTPIIEESEHTVSLTGMVDEQIDLSMDEIKNDYSTTTVAHTMQCSGNGRSYFEPQVAGGQWSFGAMGTAFYTGTPVIEILERYGADTSDENYLSVMGDDAPEGERVFSRSIPMSKVKTDCILAYQRNGVPLTRDHGFPVRLIVPGWYGCNNVKWAGRMHVMDTMLVGEKWGGSEKQTYTHWQQYSYRIRPAGEDFTTNETIPVFDTQDQLESDEVLVPYMYDMMVKSFVTTPVDGATISPEPDGTVTVIGVAWAGAMHPLDKVEVSTDGGTTWNEATFDGPDAEPSAWQLFRYEWNAAPGKHTVVSRATDAKGRVQPATISKPEDELRKITNDKYPWNAGGYGCTAYMPEAVEVTVTQEEGNMTNGNATNDNTSSNNSRSKR